MSKIYDIAILGSGLYGMTVAKLLKQKIPSASICLIERKKKVEFNRTEKIFMPVRTGEKLLNIRNQKLKEMMNKGYDQLKTLCQENEIEFENIGELIIASHKIEKEKMTEIFTESQSENFKKISFEEALTLEPLLNQKNLSLSEFYHLKNTAVADYNKLLKVMNAELSKFEGVETHFSSEIENLTRKSNSVEINTKNLKTEEKQKIEASLVVNVSGSDAMTFAHQLNELKEYSFLKVFAGDYYGNIPAKVTYPNLMISSPPFIIHPGLSFYMDNLGNKTLGPTTKTSGNTYSFFKKLKTLNQWRKVYEIFYHNKLNPEYEFKYSSKNFINQFYINVFNFQIIRLLSKDKLEYESCLVYSPEKKQINNEVIIHREKNGVHLINSNLHAGLSPILPLSEELINLI